jgi:mannose-6-phosphate isomerase-like protein (cupin superfamily)
MPILHHEDDLPKMFSTKPGRIRTLLASEELSGTQALLCGRMEYLPGAKSPYHYHVGCEHFFYIVDGKGKLRLEDREVDLEKDVLVFIPEGEKHQLLNPYDQPLTMLELQVPGKFKTEILEGNADDLRWTKADGRVWQQK